MIQSILYRLIIVVFSLWIILFKPIIVYPLWSYLCIIILYLVIFLYLKRKEKSVARLFLDYIFINLIIYGSDIYSFIVFLLIILPIINAINFSGKSNYYFLVVFFTCITFIIQSTCIKAEALLSIFLLSIIYLYSKHKARIWNIEKEISQHVDEYFLNTKQIEKPHQVYKKIMNDLNKFFYADEEKGISAITAYRLEDNTLWLINSSEFVWERKKYITKQQIDQLREESVLEFKEDSNSKLWYYIQREDIEYVFTCNITVNVFLKLYNYHKILKLTFSKASILLNVDYRIRTMRDKKFDEIKDNVLYVNQAVKVMHYIRNKMTPLKNIITYHRISENIVTPIKLQMKKRIEKEIKQADTDLNEILYFANYLLDKSNNPFIGTELTEISIKKLFIIMSEIVERQMNDIVNVDATLQYDELEKYVACLNLVECKIMLTDWVSNMNRYLNKFKSISMIFTGNNLVFHFENDYSCSEGEINKLVKDLNSKGKDAVIEGKGNGHGIYIIKSIADKLGIGVKAKIDNKEGIGNIICLDIKFEIYEKK